MKKKNLITEETADFASMNRYAMLMSGVGFAGMMYYAFKTKSGFWKGFGYVLLGSIAGAAVGSGVDSFNVKK